jgi:hypothetical protein
MSRTFCAWANALIDCIGLRTPAFIVDLSFDGVLVVRRLAQLPWGFLAILESSETASC